MTIIKCALTAEDIEEYQLPPAMTKKTDTRRAAFVAEHGDISVELDALPPRVLRERLKAEVEKHMDLTAYKEVLRLQETERTTMVDVLKAAAL